MSPLEYSQDARLGEALERLHKLHPLKIDLSLGRIERLLKALGNPERKLPPVIHVAGTNGKGSVVATLRAILEAAGLMVHVYTSPHLVSFRERIRLAGKLIEGDRLIEILKRVEAVNKGGVITFFEITTAAAFLAFSEQPADICLLEVGLGGRLDATNVIDAPLVSVITPIALDHADFLGADIEGVAREKAGIMKKGVPVVSSKQMPKAKKVLQQEAERIGAPLIFAKEAVSIPALPLSGPHQIENAQTAVTALLVQKTFKIPEMAITEGLQNVEWPARYQELDPCVFGLSRGCEVRLDGGHNPHAAKALAKMLVGNPRPLILIVGMMGNKDIKGFLEPLAPHAEHLIAVPVSGEQNAAPPETIVAAAEGLGLKAKSVSSIEEAFSEICRERSVRVLIAGSLYLAGEVLSEIHYPVK